MKYLILIPLIIFVTYRPAFTGNEDELGFTGTFLSLVNDHRESIGLKKLVHEESMDEIVGEHADEMARGKIAFGHLGFSERCAGAKQVLGGTNWCGENVARGQKTPERAFAAWMNSPGHRKNIENIKATHTGFAYTKAANGTIYWIQIFVRKK